jgi:redox-sensitive bicupin YhaK (pirin superfamily)
MIAGEATGGPAIASAAMSGPVTPADAPPVAEHGECERRVVEVFESRASRVGELTVRRALPRRGRRTVGAWCFADHMGPAAVTADRGVDVGPHPHIGLQTVTWLAAGEILHRDSLGSEQVIRAGQLNLMTAGIGVAHSEEATGRYAGELHGIQLWVAQPDATRNGRPAFEHHGDLPRVELGRGADATVFVGDFAGAVSPARRDTEHTGVDVELRSDADLPLRADYEYAIVVLDGAVEVEGSTVAPGHLAYLGSGRREVGLRRAATGAARLILLGGVPFDNEILMWWNFVARTREEVDQARAAWQAFDHRFGVVASALARIDAPEPLWRTAK